MPWAEGVGAAPRPPDAGHGDALAAGLSPDPDPDPARRALVLNTGEWRRLLVLGNLAVLLLVGLLSAVSLGQSREQFRQRALDLAQGQARALELALLTRTQRIDVALRTLADSLPDAAALPATLRLQRLLLADIDQLHLTTAQGRLLPLPGTPAPLSTAPARAALLAQVRAAPADRLVFSEPVLAADGQTWLMLLARRLRAVPAGSEGAAAEGMVHVELRTARLQALFAQTELGPQGAVSLRTQALSLVARHSGQGPPQQPQGVGTREVSNELRVALRQRPAAGQFFAAAALDGVERVNAYEQVGDYPLLLLVGLGTQDVLQAWHRNVALVGALLAGSALLLAGLSWGLYRAVQRAAQAGAGLHAARGFLARTERIAAVGGWELDLHGRQLRCTREASRILGHVPGAGLPLREVLARLSPDQRRALRRRALADLRGPPGQGAPWEMSLWLDTAAVRHLRVRIVAELVHEGGQPVRLAGALQDVTEQHMQALDLAREQALRQHSEQQVRALDALLRERRELQDLLAHEVRQPLNNASAALQGATAALTGTAHAAAALPLTRAQAVLGQVIASIDNTLAVASLLARDGPTHRADVDLDMLVAVAIGDLPAAARARVRVLRDSAVRTASLDLGLMRLALRNLLANALAYGAPGTPVTLRLGDSDEPLGLTLDVENQALGEQGVATELVPHLFERGSRGRRDRPGHGLGLYIVHRVMRLHRGQVELLRNRGGQVVMRLLLLADVLDDGPDEDTQAAPDQAARAAYMPGTTAR